MLTKPQLDRYAEVMLWGLQTARSRAFRKNDLVLVSFDLAALSLAERLNGRLLEMGLNPVLRLSPTPTLEHQLYQKSNERQLVFQAPGTRELYEKLHGAIYLHAPESLTHLRNIDARRIGKALSSRKPLRDILFRREEAGEFGWTLCTLPTAELARHAKLSPQEYSRQIVKACYLDRSDPCKAWSDLHRDAQVIKRWLNAMPIDWLRVESKSTDIRIRLGGQRRWIGVSGHNIPSFEIFVSPDWRGTEGWFHANQPSYRSGNLVKGVTLEFRKGSVVSVAAETGLEFTEKQLRLDKGANKVGEFSLTDKRFSKIDRFMANTLFDENFGGAYGNCHLAVGSAYSDTFAGNPAELSAERKKELGFNDSALHWDLVNTEDKMVTARLANGKEVVIYEKGMFVCP